MRARHITITVALLALLFTDAALAEIEAELDLRLVDSDGRNSFMDGGLGKLRFDAADDGLKLGRARLAWRDALGNSNWHANVDLSAWSLDDHHAIDLTEAWLEWRPVPKSAWRSNVKIGAFYPPISLEHRASGWTNPYTISSSALNTWIGEEFRTIGVAYGIDHLGIAAGGQFDFGAQAAVFGWNDPAGVVVAFRGFALHDRQTPLFGRIGTYAFGSRTQRVIFSEIDGRAGFHVSAYVQHDSGLELRALHYDNRGDPAAVKPSIDDYAWKTRFDSVGARYDGPHGTTLIAQWLAGDTAVGPNSHDVWHYRAAFVLAAQQFGAHRVAARYDDFRTRQTVTIFAPTLGLETGDAFTLAWSWALNEHVVLMTEWLQVNSHYNRRVRVGELPAAKESSLQLALRLSL
jgi:hypothetical protein